MDEPSELLRRQRLFSIELSGVLNKSAAGREREADEKFANKIGSQREKCFSRIFSFKLIEEFYFFLSSLKHPHRNFFPLSTF